MDRGNVPQCPETETKLSDNRRTIPRKELEDGVFAGLRTGLLNSEYLDAFTAEFQKEMNRLRKATASELASKKKRLSDVTRQIERIVDHIINGTGSKSITSKLGHLEAEQETLESQIAASEQKPPSSPCTTLAKSIARRSGN